MTQSKDNDKLFDIKVDIDNVIDTEDTITISLDNTYGTTTTYWAGDSMVDTVNMSDSTFTVDTNSFDSSIDVGWIYNNMNIDINEVEKMCKEYPALEKVWRNFKSVYDMCKKDYEGKKQAGEIDDDIPF